MVKNLSKHAEWLSLIEISGPFLTVSMLEKAFPQGLDAIETPKRQKLRAAYEEWREAVDMDDPLLSELHREWIRLVLMELLEYDHESLVQAADWPGELPTVSSQEHAGTFSPDWIVRSPSKDKPRLFISVLPPDTDLESIQRGDGWPVSLQERMTSLCRTHAVRVGLLTDGERWMLVNAPIGSTSSQASWYARLWFQEPVTLKAFHSLLGVRRCFGPAEESLEALLDESLKHHEEVTDTLGEQVRRAVEVLVQCLDKADDDRNRELLRDVKPAELYEAGLTVMMRLVFVLCAEERGLLLSGDSVYDQCYAVSTLRGQLAEEADRHGPEVLDRRHDAWARLLAVFRAVYGGIEHESLRMPALGGSLFDPDRFPFLEGRIKGTHWRDTSSAPLPIDNRTVLLLLNSLQILEQSGGALLLSYRALDVEQIGHVYEGLLEHTVARVPRVTLGLHGSQKAKNPNVALAELESARLEGEAALVKLVLEITGRSESAIKNGLSKPADEAIYGRVLGVCGGDTALAERIRPYTNLLRTDAWEDPIVYRANSFMVTLGADRRETGTHYTPKSLTESIVTTTLEPVVYVGPAEGKSREEWKLKSSVEILDLKICDPAMGSGAFLVQVCRYLGEKLVEAWLHEEAAGKAITTDGDVLDHLGAAEPMPSQLDERLTIARRLVAERCLYGVDVNPLAVELAKLSIWLVTLAKGRPFGFLDHNLRSGDSLLGLHKLEQLTKFSLHPEKKQTISLFASNIEDTVKDALALRKKLRATPIRDIRDIKCMKQLDRQARQKLEHIEHIADAMIGNALTSDGNERTLETAMDNLSTWAYAYIGGDNETGRKIIADARKSLAFDLPSGKPPRKPFHWALEFPEVFERGGFDGVVGNPPFLGNKKISGLMGLSYREFVGHIIANRKTGLADLCAYFLLRYYSLLKPHGSFGVIATDKIAQGDTVKVGLEQICNKSIIINAVKSIPWPGHANVYIAILTVFKGSVYNGTICLNGEEVDVISPMLTKQSGKKTLPFKLKESEEIGFIGSVLLGTGFILSPTEAQSLISINISNKDVIRPYLGGEDLNQKYDCRPSRFVICFWDWDLSRGKTPSDEDIPFAEDYPDCLSIVLEKVKPERDKKNRKAYRERWWRFAELSKGAYEKTGKSQMVLIRARVSPTHALTFVERGGVFSEQTVVFKGDFFEFGVMQSTIHEAWAVRYSTSKGSSTLVYSPTSCLVTFPFPCTNNAIISVASDYYEYRKDLMLELMEGLTSIYNQFHNPDISSETIQKLRNLHGKLDNVVTTAYGWDDLELDHGFHETNQGIRFTISEEARREVLQRLLKLNHERYEEEVAQGLHDKKKKKTSTPRKQKKSPARNSRNIDLFNFMNASSSKGAK